MSSTDRRLTLLVVLLALVAVLGAALTWRTHGDRADAATAQEQYGAVLTAADAEVTASLVAQGAEPAPTTPQELGRFIQEDTARWAKLVKDRNLKLD